jgi:predicted peroxiredoxin
MEDAGMPTPQEDRRGLEAVVVLTTGKQDRGTRATLAFAWACASLAVGRKTAVFLTMDGTVWALQGTAKGVQVQGFEPVENYLREFLEMGGQLLVCGPCSEYYCHGLADGQSRVLLEGAEVAGLGTIVTAVGPGCSVVTF